MLVGIAGHYVPLSYCILNLPHPQCQPFRDCIAIVLHALVQRVWQHCSNLPGMSLMCACPVVVSWIVADYGFYSSTVNELCQEETQPRSLVGLYLAGIAKRLAIFKFYSRIHRPTRWYHDATLPGTLHRSMLQHFCYARSAFAVKYLMYLLATARTNTALEQVLATGFSLEKQMCTDS